MHINVDGNAIQFESALVLAELACRILIQRRNTQRPNESAPVTAIRQALRNDFAATIGSALKAEETASRSREILIGQIGPTGLDSIGADLGVKREVEEADAEYRGRLLASNMVEEQPLHKSIRDAGESMISELLKTPDMIKIMEGLASSYGI